MTGRFRCLFAIADQLGRRRQAQKFGERLRIARMLTEWVGDFNRLESTRSCRPPRQLQSPCMSVESHFAKKDPSVLATYRRVLDVARALGPVAEEAKTSAHRWHVEVRLTAPAQVDRQLIAWLRAAYELAGR
jgi:hypothetical protein